jgi:hypothetical protein
MLIDGVVTVILWELVFVGGGRGMRIIFVVCGGV